MISVDRPAGGPTEGQVGPTLALLAAALTNRAMERFEDAVGVRRGRVPREHSPAKDARRAKGKQARRARRRNRRR